MPIGLTAYLRTRRSLATSLPRFMAPRSPRSGWACSMDMTWWGLTLTGTTTTRETYVITTLTFGTRCCTFQEPVCTGASTSLILVSSVDKSPSTWPTWRRPIPRWTIGWLCERCTIQTKCLWPSTGGVSWRYPSTKCRKCHGMSSVTTRNIFTSFSV